MNYYLINIHWTSESDSDINSSFIVEAPNTKDAIIQVLMKHSFLTLDESFKIYAKELGLALRGNRVIQVGSTVIMTRN